MKKINLNSPYIPILEYPRAPDLEMALRIILGRGIFERRSFEKFMSHAKGRNTVIEVGAHVGSWTLGFSKLFEHVVGFEPQPQNRAHLNDNIARANARNIQIYPFAIVNDLRKKFQISASGTTRNSGMAHLTPDDPTNQNGISVECVALDEFLKTSIVQCVRSIDAIKIDVEGMELEVLKSGKELIREHKPTLLVEVNRSCSRYGISHEEIFDYLSDQGYENADKTRNDFIFVPK